MKRFVIFDSIDGNVRVTDSEATANRFAPIEDYFVFDNQNGMWLCADGNYYPPEDLDEPDDVDSE